MAVQAVIAALLRSGVGTAVKGAVTRGAASSAVRGAAARGAVEGGAMRAATGTVGRAASKGYTQGVRAAVERGVTQGSTRAAWSGVKAGVGEGVQAGQRMASNPTFRSQVMREAAQKSVGRAAVSGMHGATSGEWRGYTGSHAIKGQATTPAYLGYDFGPTGPGSKGPQVNLMQETQKAMEATPSQDQLEQGTKSGTGLALNTSPAVQSTPWSAPQNFPSDPRTSHVGGRGFRPQGTPRSPMYAPPGARPMGPRQPLGLPGPQLALPPGPS